MIAFLIAAVLCLAASTTTAEQISSVPALIKTNPCIVGPSYWCQTKENQNVCQVSNVTIGVCGYSNNKCPLTLGSSFCETNTSQIFNGGLVGIQPGYTGYYALALYWAPTSCSPTVAYNPSSGFCSAYTLVINIYEICLSDDPLFLFNSNPILFSIIICDNTVRCICT